MLLKYLQICSLAVFCYVPKMIIYWIFLFLSSCWSQLKKSLHWLPLNTKRWRCAWRHLFPISKITIYTPTVFIFVYCLSSLNRTTDLERLCLIVVIVLWSPLIALFSVFFFVKRFTFAVFLSHSLSPWRSLWTRWGNNLWVVLFVFKKLHISNHFLKTISQRNATLNSLKTII